MLVTETFIFFDRDLTYSAAFVIVLISIIKPELVAMTDLKSSAFAILDDMIEAGSIPSAFRKIELESLEVLQDLFAVPPPPREDRSFPATHIVDDVTTDTTINESMESIPADGSAVIDFDAFTGLSPDQILSVAQLWPLQNDSAPQDSSWLDSWVWD